MRRFIYGERSTKNGKTYEYGGFVREPGVRYLGHSVVFVTGDRLRTLARFLRSNGVEIVVTEASLGRIVRV